MLEIQIRPAEPTDIDALAELLVESYACPPWNETWSRDAAHERLRGILSGKDFRGAVALAGDAVVGALLGRKERWIDGFHFCLQELCVVPGRHRSGVGRALVHHMTQKLRREDTEGMYVITPPGDGPAGFYEKLGFYTSKHLVMACTADEHRS